MKKEIPFNAFIVRAKEMIFLMAFSALCYVLVVVFVSLNS